MQSHNPSTHINPIVDEQKAPVQAYLKEQVLKQGMDAPTKESNSTDRWSLFGASFSNLIDYCAIVATSFPRTSTLEPNFLFFSSYVRRKRFSVERCMISIWKGVMQTKQYLMIQQLLLLLIEKCPIYLSPILTLPYTTKIS